MPVFSTLSASEVRTAIKGEDIWPASGVAILDSVLSLSGKHHPTKSAFTNAPASLDLISSTALWWAVTIGTITLAAVKTLKTAPFSAGYAWPSFSDSILSLNVRLVNTLKSEWSSIQEEAARHCSLFGLSEAIRTATFDTFIGWIEGSVQMKPCLHRAILMHWLTSHAAA